MTSTIELSKKLINIKSITPNDPGCQTILMEMLSQQGYHITPLNGSTTKNFWAEQPGTQPLLAFSGHTDTVPAGDLQLWPSDPFTASIRDNHLYGRGAADMKCAIAAMLLGQQRFSNNIKNPAFRMGFMITSDEEGDATEGTKKIVEHLLHHSTNIKWCLIGEATSIDSLGDSVKIGRRGSLHGELQLHGQQGHIAYPQLAENPIHKCLKALDELTAEQWDQGNRTFTPTSFQIYHIHADTGTTNMIPGTLSAAFNFRFCPESDAESLKRRVHETLNRYSLRYDIKWNLMSSPFCSKTGLLLDSCRDAIRIQLNQTATPNTEGGTSDGRFIIKTGCEIVELGPINATIHKVNECVSVTDLQQLEEIYHQTLHQLQHKLVKQKEGICNIGS